jgi:predicted ATPase
VTPGAFLKDWLEPHSSFDRFEDCDIMMKLYERDRQMSTLYQLDVKGFKSIKDQTLEFAPINVFIGGNGTGKSNLIGVFHFLHRIVNKELQTYTGEAGGANAILFFGRKVTKELSLRVDFRDGKDANAYALHLLPTDEDRFVINGEFTHYRDMRRYEYSLNRDAWSGHSEARIAEATSYVAGYVRRHLDSYRIYHFHDTTASAPVKQTADVEDNRFLRPDAGNLAAFLYRLKQTEVDYFQNIEDAVKQVAPFFRRFRLEPSLLNPDKIRLEWEEAGSDMYFGPAALSDGTLRFMCLATLLLQPRLPSLILIDEPELGLHPAAIQLLADLLQSASTRTQLIVATQSVTLINQLQPEHVWVTDLEGGESVFRHLRSVDMSAWLEDYGLGELWEKNIIGGRP